MNTAPTSEACTRPTPSSSRWLTIASRVLFVGISILCSSFWDTPSAQNTYQVVTDLGTSQGYSVDARLIQSADGRLYGTATAGGAYNSGTVFSIDAFGVLTTLHSFDGTNGGTPAGGVVMGPDGYLYGTTASGGSNNFGTLYRLNPGSTAFTVLYSFGNVNQGTGQFIDGYSPHGGLTVGPDGLLYGTTVGGGPGGAGTVYRMTTDGTITLLHSFTYDTTLGIYYGGFSPQTALVFGTDGNVYGTTSNSAAHGNGAIFRINPVTGTLTVVHDFAGPDPITGIYPEGRNTQSALITAADGTLYGTATQGGANDLGTVFRLTSSGTFVVLRSFAGYDPVLNVYPDGYHPAGGLTLAPDGTLYGTAYAGGSYANGVIFKITPSNGFGLVHSFGQTDPFSGTAPDGSLLLAGVTLGSDGRLYGTTATHGGSSYGTAFAYDLAASSLQTLHHFNGTPSSPIGALVRDAAGNFFGATTAGGSPSYGTVFRVSPEGVLTVLHLFQSRDGASPQAGLVRGADGNFYGTTLYGGANNLGAIFKITPSGVFTLLHSFAAYDTTLNYHPDGIYPASALLLGADGNLYGTAQGGGPFSGGVIFSVTPTGSFNVVHAFGQADPTSGIAVDGVAPLAGLTAGADGRLYGTTTAGGNQQQGTVFAMNAGGDVSPVYSFASADGRYAYGALTLASDGNLYGTTSQGSPSDSGTVFRVNPATGAYTTLHAFSGTDGARPFSGLIQGSDGAFYGTTSQGGADPGAGDAGTVFRITAQGAFTTAYTFNQSGSSGYVPMGGLIETSPGVFYGTTQSGGPSFRGVIYRLTIPPVVSNTPPVASDAMFNTLEDAPVSGSAIAGDIDSNPLTYTIVSNGTKGTAVLTNASTGAFTYTPMANANGTDTFTFKANDRTADSNVATITIAIEAVNDAPVASDGSLQTSEDAGASGTLSASDVDSASLTYAIVANGTKGTAAITNATTGDYTYTPNPNATGTDTFAFRAGDDTLQSNMATITVTILPLNDPPAAVDGALSVVGGAAATGTLVANDIDGPGLTYAIVTNGSQGTAVVTNAATGAYTYTANAGASGTDTFTFRANDGSLDSNTATVTVTIAPGNQAPVARTGVVTTQEGAAVIGTLQASDPNGDAITFSLVSQPSQGTVTLTDASTGAFTYTPNAGATGYDTFTFEVSDGAASSTGTQMVFIVAAAPNWVGPTRVSIASDGSQGNGHSIRSRVNADGRFVVFESFASTLTANDTNGTLDVFIHDRQLRKTTRVSVASDGSQGDRESSAPAVSADGRFVVFESWAATLIPGDSNGAFDVFVHDRQTTETTRVSVASDGTQGNSTSRWPSISADGRFVAFTSYASNLVPGDTNGSRDVFVHDRQLAQTTRVSVASDGAQVNGASDLTQISADGRFIVFMSDASTVVPGDTNGVFDVFVRDRRAEQTTRVSVASDGSQSNARSVEGQVSADGRFVVFVSEASNLVPDDTNEVFDVFVHDRLGAQTTRVSVGSNGAQGNWQSVQATLSADGRFVAFTSRSNTLVTGDTNGAHDVFVHDRQAAHTTRVNAPSYGPQTGVDSWFPTISGDGRFLGFESGDLLVPGKTNSAIDVFAVGGASVAPTAHSMSGNGGTGESSVTFVFPGTPWIAVSAEEWITVTDQSSTSGNGTATYSVAPNTTGTARTGTVFVAAEPVLIQQRAEIPVAFDGFGETNEDTPVAGSLTALDPNGDPLNFALVDNGTRGVAAITNAATGAFIYTPNPNEFGSDSFTFRVDDGTADSNLATITVSVAPVNDAPVALNGSLTTTENTAATGTLVATDIDSHGRTFTIVTNGTKGTATIGKGGNFTYTPNPNVSGADTFTFKVNDGQVDSNVATVTVTITPVNHAPQATTGVVTTTESVAVTGMLQATDQEGTPVTFALTSAARLGTVVLTNPSTGAFTYTPNSGATGYDTFRFEVSDGSAASTGTQMVFIVANSPRWPGQTVLASEHTDGTRGNLMSAGSSLSADGRHVVFWSVASTLVTGDTNNTHDVFVRDRATGETRRVSLAHNGAQGNNQSINPSITPDGRYVAFVGLATNLVVNDNNNWPDVFVHDLATGVTERVNVAGDGTEANNQSFWRPSISADGRFVAFESDATNLVPDDTNGDNDYFVRDRLTGLTTRVSIATGGTQAIGNFGVSRGPVISADGRYVAFNSYASNLVVGDTNSTSDVFVHDRYTGQTSRTSVQTDGSQMSGGGASFAMSANGRYVAFESFANGMVAIFVRDLIAQETSLVGPMPQGPDMIYSFEPALSADGRFVAFNVIIDDGITFERKDFYIAVIDRLTGNIRRIDVDNAGVPADGFSVEPAISADGQFVSGSTDSLNLVPPTTNGARQVFVVGGVAVTPATEAFPAGGGHGSLNVSFVYPGTSWSAASNDLWIAITDQSSTNGNGTVMYSVAPNTTGSPRTGTLIVAAQTVTIQQDASGEPLASDGELATQEDTTTTGSLTATDPNGDPLTFSIVANGTLGVATITNPATGAFTYTPEPNAHGTDSFTYQASNGTTTSNVATVTVTITPVNDAPVSSDGLLAATEDVAANGMVLATDVDSSSLTYSIVANGTRGTAVITNAATGAFTYTPGANANGTDTFTFRANDGTIDSNVATVSVTINAVNDAPTASNGTLTTNEDTAAAGTLNATDLDGDPLAFSIVTNGTKGVVTITNVATGAFTYTPNGNANGNDSFTFKAGDGTVDSPVATISVTIAPVNDAPVAQNGSNSVFAGASVSGTLVATDTDSAALTYLVVVGGTKGTAVVTNPSTGAYTYTANAGASGTDAFTFRANDGILDSNVATITVTIATNRPPTASAGSITTQEDKSANGMLSATDPDGNRLTFSIVLGGSKGTATITNATTGRFAYVPNANANGTDTFAFKVNDGIEDSNTATVTVTITAINDAPVASDASYTMTRNSVLDATLAGTDVDGDQVTYSITKAPRKGTITNFNPATGTFTYTPSAGFTGTDSFTFKVSDGSATSAAATVSIRVN